MGKFVIEEDWTIRIVEEKKPKKDQFCFQVESKSFKQPRWLAAESEQQRKDWIQTLQGVINEVKQGKVRDPLVNLLSLIHCCSMPSN